MKRTPWILLVLTPGIGLILFFIGAVFAIAAAQSFGFYGLMGESGFFLGHWMG